MWSSGNEVPDQWEQLVKRAKWLQEIFHHRRPNTSSNCGYGSSKSNNGIWFWSCAGRSRIELSVHLYDEAFAKFPQGFILGSETASTVSSRGIYKFPWFKKK
jgi:beta-galactosidase